MLHDQSFFQKGSNVLENLGKIEKIIITPGTVNVFAVYYPWGTIHFPHISHTWNSVEHCWAYLMSKSCRALAKHPASNVCRALTKHFFQACPIIPREAWEHTKISFPMFTCRVLGGKYLLSFTQDDLKHRINGTCPKNAWWMPVNTRKNLLDEHVVHMESHMYVQLICEVKILRYYFPKDNFCTILCQMHVLLAFPFQASDTWLYCWLSVELNKGYKRVLKLVYWKKKLKKNNSKTLV